MSTNEVRYRLTDLEKKLLDTVAKQQGSKPGLLARHYLLEALRKQQQENHDRP